MCACGTKTWSACDDAVFKYKFSYSPVHIECIRRGAGEVQHSLCECVYGTMCVRSIWKWKIVFVKQNKSIVYITFRLKQ